VGPRIRELRGHQTVPGGYLGLPIAGRLPGLFFMSGRCVQTFHREGEAYKAESLKCCVII
jgi:hypothetical protein